ncbi:MAG TPA: lytic transglycosylase domain-containing protein [Polyangiaceae bacterium]|nr:lytic transglycosylase domain-containing protein [Polyangiaceae bacterium]
MRRTTKHATLLASLWLACNAVTERRAAAEVFRYTDRSGRAHLVSTGPARAPAPPTDRPADPPAADASPPTRPAAVGLAKPYDALAREAAEANALAPELVLAVIEAESGFNPRAISPKGALGLMQLMPETASLLGVTDPFEPRQNVAGGAKLLRSLLDEFDGQLVLALAAYNAGAAVVRRHGAIPPIAETQGYVASVLRAYQRLLDAGRDEGGAVGPRPPARAPSSLRAARPPAAPSARRPPASRSPRPRGPSAPAPRRPGPPPARPR